MDGNAFGKSNPGMPDAATHGPMDTTQREHEPLVAVIEDDAAIRTALALVLADRGYTPLQGAGSGAILSMLGGTARRLAAIVSDFHLGDAETGVEAVLAIRRALGWRVPAVIMSGSFGRSASDAASPHDLPVLTKPFEPALLERLLEHELAAVRT
jgi:CheY-like chemotaxis protein